MKCLFETLLVMTLASAGCRSMAPGERAAAAGARPSATGQEVVAADLPGIGEAPDVVPTDQPIAISDPAEPVNRAFFYFNDKLYFYVLKPLSKGYNWVLPQSARLCVKNFFSNLATPARLVNCAFQTEFEGAWVEVERFAINTTCGVAGLGDPARHRWNLLRRNEDLGQTLGYYGLGTSFYICWPVLGPSNVRDTVGYIGDTFLDPVNYLVSDIWINLGVKSYETVNGTSLRIGDYEDLKEAAIDPYISIRDAYYQYRRNQVMNGVGQSERPANPTGEK